MDVGQLAAEAVRDLTVRISAQPGETAEPSDDVLLEAFTQLAAADGWGKLALQRVRADPRDLDAAQELCRSLEQAARLHPGLASRLQQALGGSAVPHPR